MGVHVWTPEHGHVFTPGTPAGSCHVPAELGHDGEDNER